MALFQIVLVPIVVFEVDIDVDDRNHTCVDH